MTVEEFLSEQHINSGIELAMIGFAKLKCKELLKIVAKRAKIVDGDGAVYQQPHVFYCNGEIYETMVDRDSILNAVDLDSFII